MNYYPYISFPGNPFNAPFPSHLQMQPPYMSPNLMENIPNEDGSKPWTEWDDQRLKAASEKYNNKGWRKICLSAFPDGSRTKEECLKRWRQLTKSVSVKGLWTAEEDSKLTALVNEMGAEKWVAIANRLGTRTGKQCRERWHNHLDPRINKAPFTSEEEQLIFKLHAKIGSKWAEMSKHLPGRSDNSIKNFFNTAMQRKRKAQQANAKNELKRHKDINAFNWSPQDAKAFLSQYPTPNLSSDLHNTFNQLNLRLTPPDTPQNLNLGAGLDYYNHWTSFPTKPNFLTPTMHKLDLLNMTPITNSSPALPQGTFERAVFDTKGLASNPNTPNNFGHGFYNHNFSNMTLNETEDKDKQSNQDNTTLMNTNNNSNDNINTNLNESNNGYHLGLVGVGYDEVQDYLFMNQ